MSKQNQKITLKDLGELCQQEIELIHYIRTRFRYGDIIIQTRDGLPYRIAKTTEYQSLDN